MAKVFSIKRVLTVLWFALFPLFLLFWYAPVISLRIRLITLAIVVCILAGALWLVWMRRRFRWSLICLYAMIAVLIALPIQRPVNRPKLRARYCRDLSSYAGCKYVWGGEGRFAMDCSGLVRKALEDALFSRGIRTFNPSLVRESLWLWWNDTTARVIGEGYDGRTCPVTTTPTLNILNYSLLKPGDLAVTASGDHVMAYLGDRKWIAADPAEKRVTVFKIPEKRNGYFSTPMKIVRWQVLE